MPGAPPYPPAMQAPHFNYGGTQAPVPVMAGDAIARVPHANQGWSSTQQELRRLREDVEALRKGIQTSFLMLQKNLIVDMRRHCATKEQVTNSLGLLVARMTSAPRGSPSGGKRSRSEDKTGEVHFGSFSGIVVSVGANFGALSRVECSGSGCMVNRGRR